MGFLDAGVHAVSHRHLPVDRSHMVQCFRQNGFLTLFSGVAANRKATLETEAQDFYNASAIFVYFLFPGVLRLIDTDISSITAREARRERPGTRETEEEVGGLKMGTQQERVAPVAITKGT